MNPVLELAGLNNELQCHFLYHLNAKLLDGIFGHSDLLIRCFHIIRHSQVI